MKRIIYVGLIVLELLVISYKKDFWHDLLYPYHNSSSTHSPDIIDEVLYHIPQYKVCYQQDSIGVDMLDDRILNYEYDAEQRKWDRGIRLPFPIGKVVNYQDQLLISDVFVRQYYTVDLDSHTIQEFSFPKEYFAQTQNPITSLEIDEGYHGCIGGRSRVKIFHRKGDMFELDLQHSDSSFLKKMSTSIPDQAVILLAKKIYESRHEQLKIKDLQITQQDIAIYQELIEKKQSRIIRKLDAPNLFDSYLPNEGNIDFEFYKTIGDSLSTLPDSIIDLAFSGYPYGNDPNTWTSYEWHEVRIIFKDQSVLEIGKREHNTNRLYGPWEVEMGGLVFKTNSVNLGRHIDNFTQGEFLDSTAKDKSYALFKIADYLYHTTVLQGP